MTEVNVSWKLRNTEQIAWPTKMQLIPTLISPATHCYSDSEICQL